MQQRSPATFETATWVRRVAALFVDWLACTLVVTSFTGRAYAEPGGPEPLYVLLLFVVESALLTMTLGGSFGKLATRLRVVRVDGRAVPPEPLRAIVRAVLVALVIPPLVFRPDRRGLHDLAAGTTTVPLHVYRSLRAR